MADAIIATRNGQPVYLRDVATVSHGYKEREAITRVDGKEAIELAVYKEGDANTVQLAAGIRARVEEIGKSLPEGTVIKPVYDQSHFIDAAISEVKSAALIGGLLAILVLYAFLRDARATLITGIAIPVSVLGTFVMMYAFDLTLNIMSLGGIALAVGMLVDNAVVVLESIVRKQEHGMDRREAARRGTAEVAMAVTAATLTSVAVFFPMVFITGVAGQLFKDQSLTVSFALAFSLIVALDPGADAGGRRPPSCGRRARRRRSRSRAAPVRRRALRDDGSCAPGLRLDRARLRARAEPAGARHAGRQPLGRPQVPARDHLGARPSRTGDRRRRGALRADAGADRAASRHRADPADVAGRVQRRPAAARGNAARGNRPRRRRRAAREHGARQRRSRLLGGGHGQSSRCQPRRRRARTPGASASRWCAGSGRAEEEAAMAGMRRSLESLPGVQYQFSRPSLFALSTPLEVVVSGYDLDRLRDAAEQVRLRMQADGRFADVKSTVEAGNPEIQIVFDQERATQLGLVVRDIADRVVNSVRGEVATRYTLVDKKIDVLVRSVDTRAASIEEVRNLIVNPGSDFPVPLSAVADVKLAIGPAEVRRIGQERVAVVSANLAQGDLGAAVDALEDIVAEVQVPVGTTAFLSGQSEDMSDSFRSLQFVLLLAIFLVYLVMASQFESLIHPFVILLTIPLAIIGAVWALWITGTTVNVVAYIGLIMLAGIVVNQSIVLIDAVNQARERGLSKREAIIEAGRVRLRPILITKLTTILGLLPMALGIGEGAEVRAPMAITVIGGVLLTTFLTLLVIPVVYSVLDRKVYAPPTPAPDAAAEPATG